MTTRFQMLGVQCLQPGRYQPRKHFAEPALQELAQSIISQGLIEPLIVREITAHHFEILAGERRWRAAQIAGLSEVPCLIGDYSDEQAAALTLVENIQRQELNLIEEAQGYRRLYDEFHFQQQEIALLVGKSRSHVTNILRLLTLEPSVQEFVKEGSLSFGHVRTLIGMAPLQQQGLAQQAIAKQWSVRQLEEKARLTKNSPDLVTPASNTDLDRLQTLLADQVGAPVQIVSNEQRGGWLQIKFFDNDTLEGLLERLGLRYD